MKIYYKAGYKYQLHKSVTVVTKIRPSHYINTRYIELQMNGTLHITVGYAWDGPSGPTIDRPRDHVMPGSLVHDALCELMRTGHLPASARLLVDLELKRICLEEGMWKWRANSWYKSVRAVGKGSTLPKNKKKIYIAGS